MARFLAIFFVLMTVRATLAADAVEQAARGPGAATSGPGFRAQVEKAAFLLVNQYRHDHDLPMLTWNEAVAREARRHSQDMAGGKVDFGHDGFRDRVDRLQPDISRILGAGENVFMSSNPEDVAQSAVTAWLHSPHHLANIRGDFNLSGLGVAQDKDGVVYFTQLFVKSSPAAEPSETSAETSVQSPFGLLATPETRKVP